MNQKLQKEPILVNGYAYPEIRPEVLKQWVWELSFLSAFSYSFTADGNLNELDDTEMIESASAGGVHSFMSITNLDETGFNSKLAKDFLESLVAQYTLIDQAVSIVKEKGLIGVNFDLEYIPAENKDQYTRFIANAARRLNELGYLAAVAVAPKTSASQQGLLYEAHDYFGLGQVANYVIPMTYEWGYTYGPPMAVAPLNQVEKVISYAVSEIEPKKLLMGVPNYGYDWKLPFEKGQTKAESISNVEAAARADWYDAQIQYDETAQSPFYYYTDPQENEHVVWFEDQRSMDAKLGLMGDYGLAGISIWTVMELFPEGAEAIAKQYQVIKV